MDSLTGGQHRAEVSALGLDIGRKRIGVAGCDRTGLIATGLTTLYWQSFATLVEALADLVHKRQAELLVVGLPLTMEGTEGFQARQVRKVGDRLGRALGLPIVYVDERLTSVEAEQLIQAERRSPRDNKGLVDRKAAALILQRWLEQRRGT